MAIILEESYPASRGSPSKIEQPLLAGQSRHCNFVVVVQGQHQKKRDARLESLPCFVAYSKKKRKGFGVSYIGTSNIQLHNIVWALRGGGRGGKAVIFPCLKTAKCLNQFCRQLYNVVDTIWSPFSAHDINCITLFQVILSKVHIHQEAITYYPSGGGSRNQVIHTVKANNFRSFTRLQTGVYSVLNSDDSESPRSVYFCCCLNKRKKIKLNLILAVALVRTGLGL